MPYNNTPIQPPREYTGLSPCPVSRTSLPPALAHLSHLASLGSRAEEMLSTSSQPLQPVIFANKSITVARVKKIIHADDDIQSCSNNAAFVITIATEMFIQHLVERTHEIVKAEKRPRRNCQYNDVANAVARLDNLEFLSDVVPRTTTFAKHLDRKKRAQDAEARAAAEAANRSPIQHPNHSRGPSGSGGYTNGNHHSPSHSFSGPGARAGGINLLDDGDAMEVDQRPASRSQQQIIPTTMELLERARAAQARAELGLTHSPSLPPHPPHMSPPN